MESGTMTKGGGTTLGGAEGAETASQTAGRAAGKYLTFQLDREEFGIGVLQVREIMALQDITAVPQTPEYVKGVINLRGKLIPVICLRARFGLPVAEYGPRTSIIVVEVRGESSVMQVGIIVDEVSEVLNVAASDIEPTPDFGGAAAPSYLLGMAKSKDRVKILLDIDHLASQVASAAEVEALRAVRSSSETNPHEPVQ
jgi:purine-binding chemotaxis protein CheW